jgi:DNA polymerase-4
MERYILHADMDAFYASVERLDDPALEGKPLVVGGSPEGRGVVAAASYEARKYGAMPMRTAVRLCENLVRVSPHFDRYREISSQAIAQA